MSPPWHLACGAFSGLLDGIAGSWRDNDAWSRLSVHSQPLAAMHDAVRVGLECKPAVGPANASLIASPDKNLQRDTRYP